MENPIGSDLEPVVDEMGRRAFLKGSAAAVVLIGTGDYTKPALRFLGIAGAHAVVSPIPPNGLGFTPGFWANSGTNGAGGNDYWNTANDPQWQAAGGAGTNPFTHSTLFNSFFTAHSALAGLTMWTLASGGGGSLPVAKTARQLVAAYLNASFNAGYEYTPAALKTMWTTALGQGNSALNALGELLDAANND